MMKFFRHCLYVLATSTVMLSGVVHAFDFAKSTPVGSWQTTEQKIVDHKGNTSVMVMKYSLVGEETRNGKAYVWMEVNQESYKVNNDQRQKQGAATIIKLLVDKRFLQQDPQNAANNFMGFGEEIIAQVNGGTPIRFKGGDAIMDSMMKSLAPTMEYDFTEGAKTTVNVPAGKFDCTNFNGTGSSEKKGMFRTVSTSSTTESCYSSDVPFGMVYSKTDTVSNGKHSTMEGRLLKYGRNGAKSEISGTPMEMPKLF